MVSLSVSACAKLNLILPPGFLIEPFSTHPKPTPPDLPSPTPFSLNKVRLLYILNTLLVLPKSSYFRDRLNAIRIRLVNNCYSEALDLINDVRKVWVVAFQTSPSGSNIHRSAVTLSLLFECEVGSMVTESVSHMRCAMLGRRIRQMHWTYLQGVFRLIKSEMKTVNGVLDMKVSLKDLPPAQFLALEQYVKSVMALVPARSEPSESTDTDLGLDSMS